MYRVYGYAATRAFRVLWALEEIGAPYEHIPSQPHAPDIRERNPSGKVPVVDVDGTILTDSSAIMTYIADKHGALTYPAGTLERAQQDSVTQTVLDELDALLWTAARHSFILPEKMRVPEIKAPLKKEVARNLERIAQSVVGPFVTGDMMTIADIVFVHCCDWAQAAKFDPSPSALDSYLSAMRARPAYKAARGKRS